MTFGSQRKYPDIETDTDLRHDVEVLVRPLGTQEYDNFGDSHRFMRSVGPKYEPHDMNAPMADGKDIAGLVAAVVITLGPLAAFSLGLMG